LPSPLEVILFCEHFESPKSHFDQAGDPFQKREVENNSPGFGGSDLKAGHEKQGNRRTGRRRVDLRFDFENPRREARDPPPVTFDSLTKPCGKGELRRAKLGLTNLFEGDFASSAPFSARGEVGLLLKPGSAR
jgi:hypothetical protein